MLRWLSIIALAGISSAYAGDSTYRFHVSLLNHINDNAKFPPSYTQTGTGPVGDVISGRMSATVNVDQTELAKLVNVNTPSHDDDLAGFAISITFNDSGIGVDISPKPVGNTASLGGTADKTGKVNANFQGQLINNGKRFKFYASNLNLQQILSIQTPTQAVVKTDASEIRIKIQGKGTDPETGNQIAVTLVDEIVTFNFTITARQDTSDADRDGDTTELSYAVAVGKGIGKPSGK